MKLIFKNISSEKSSFQFYGNSYHFYPMQTRIIEIDDPIVINDVRTMNKCIKFMGIEYDENFKIENGRNNMSYDNILLVFGPYDEFHVFNRFNLRLPELKQEYPNYKIIVVTPETAACIITNADEIISFSTEKLKETGSNYPDVLERMGTMERYDYGYGVSNFMQDAIKFVTKKYKNSKIEVILYTNDHQFTRKTYMPIDFKVFNGKGFDKDLIYWIFNDFDCIRDSIISGHTIKPYIEDYEKIRNKYFKFFHNRKTFIFLTRNFKNKQPHIFNTDQNQLNIIKKILDSGYTVVNFGCPCVKYNIEHENYFEIEEDLTYSETISLFYLSNGVFLRADAGGFSTHACVNTNLFLLTEEWEKKDLLYNARKHRHEYETFKVNIHNVIDCINIALNKNTEKRFSNKDNVYLIDKIDNYSIKNIINSQKNKEALVIALGPSLNNKNIEDMSKNKIVISCNLWFRHFKVYPDYWVFANPSLNIKVLTNKIIDILKDNKKPTIVYADSVDLTEKEYIDNISKLNNIQFISYDQRHFNSNPCNSGVYYDNNKKCCDNLQIGRLTIQEELKKYTRYDTIYSSGDTVAVHMIALAILLGCKDISIIGLDLNYKNGYAKILNDDNVSGLHSSLYESPPSNILDDCMSNIYNDLNIIVESAKKIGVNINFIK